MGSEEPMMKNRNIICFAPYGWSWKGHGSCKRFMNIFSRENRVLYVNNIQFVRPRVREIGTSAFRKRLTRKLKSVMKPFLRADRSLYVYTPLVLPHYGSRIKKGVNEILLRWQMMGLQRLLKFEKPVVWIENPVGITVAKYLKPATVVYYRIDKFECHNELRDPGEIASLDERLTREADLILCVSLRLYEEKRVVRREGVHYVPHGVDFHHFHKATELLPLPEDARDIRHPVVGYFGTLDAKNDNTLIHFCATRRPDLSFILIGEKGGRHHLLEGLPNVHFLGYKAYEELPRYGRIFDACIMFWKVDDWIRFCNPVKTLEYLAMGKPVISVAFDEVLRGYGGMVTAAHSHEEFLEKIEDEIAHDSEERRRARLDFAKNETWEARAEYVSGLVGLKNE